MFEGIWSWELIFEKNYLVATTLPSRSIKSKDLKKKKNEYFQKAWKLKPKFLTISHGFRPNRSIDSAIKQIKK